MVFVYTEYGSIYHDLLKICEKMKIIRYEENFINYKKKIVASLCTCEEVCCEMHIIGRQLIFALASLARHVTRVTSRHASHAEGVSDVTRKRLFLLRPSVE